ncbi:MAG: hypothetical protein KJZ75_16980 [Hyphomonadaceae bacterium]|nr:hypothetical protein [Hyphomonadaceae bacterium]GIK50896.1 MAG: hypothetical protein BroJett013_35930 [Alphaproteobacteria bacterium]
MNAIASDKTATPPEPSNYPELAVEHGETFRRFLAGVLLVTTQFLQAVALLTVAFAIGAGWWAGLALFILIGAAVGLAFRRSAIFWSLEAVETVALILGGLIAGAFLR